MMTEVANVNEEGDREERLWGWGDWITIDPWPDESKDCRVQESNNAVACSTK